MGFEVALKQLFKNWFPLFELIIFERCALWIVRGKHLFIYVGLYFFLSLSFFLSFLFSLFSLPSALAQESCCIVRKWQVKFFSELMIFWGSKERLYRMFLWHSAYEQYHMRVLTEFSEEELVQQKISMCGLHVWVCFPRRHSLWQRGVSPRRFLKLAR